MLGNRVSVAAARTFESTVIRDSGEALGDRVANAENLDGAMLSC